MASDWRLPENRREAFQRSYSFHLKHKTHPGLVYLWLPAIADAYELDTEQREWLAWLNGNTQNPVMSLLLLEAAPRAEDWEDAVAFWNDNFKAMDWDTDRRHQKGKFGEATAAWFEMGPLGRWEDAGMWGWDATWKHALSQPYMGRLSAWSMTEFARILLGSDVVPDTDTFMMKDLSGSLSHRNAALLVGGLESVYWKASDYTGEGKTLWKAAEVIAEDLLTEALERNPGHPDVSRLSLESALCTYKSWHKPNRRYPNCYADMGYNRLRKAEARFGHRFDILWEARKQLPAYLRLEDTPHDPGLVPEKQNYYLETGTPVMLHHEHPDMQNPFNLDIDLQLAPLRKEPRWS